MECHYQAQITDNPLHLEEGTTRKRETYVFHQFIKALKIK